MKHILTVNDVLIQRSATFHLQIERLVLGSGRLLCITGPNGSGKTTFIECISGLLAPGKGVITVNGRRLTENLYPTKASIGFIPDDESWFIKELSAREYFALLIKIFRKAGVTSDMNKRVAWLADALRFTAFDQPVSSLSHGNIKKVQIIAGLMHQPKLLIIDELRNGLDPLSIISAESLIKAELDSGTCVIAATHDLWWAQRMADEIILLNRGAVVIHKKTTAIIKEHGTVESLFMALMGKRT